MLRGLSQSPQPNYSIPWERVSDGVGRAQLHLSGASSTWNTQPKTRRLTPHVPADRMVCCKLVIMYQLLALSVKLRGKEVIWFFLSILNN